MIKSSPNDRGKIEKLYELIFLHEERIVKLEKIIITTQGAMPAVLPHPNGKSIYNGYLKQAALVVIGMYAADQNNTNRIYKDLRDASDRFFDQHYFVHKPQLTKTLFYDNVKKANAVWCRGKEGK